MKFFKALTLSICLLLVTCFKSITPTKVKTFLAPQPSNEVATNHQHCDLKVVDPVGDFVLQKFMPKIKELTKTLPDVDTDSVLLTDIRLGGMDTLHRSCDTQLNHDKSTQEVKLSACLGLHNVQLEAKATAKTLLGKFNAGTLRVNVRNVSLQVGVSMRLEAGHLPKLLVFEISRMDHLSLDSSGLAGSFDWLANALLKTSLKETILRKVEKEAKTGIQKAMNALQL